ncbi:NarJ Nitrate reductase delta subunit [Candidatus Planktophila vernalis]|uniref:nitrate reductase molybdenum cofactor assembly chaperone n=1 Tax=Candidatus Planktophila vernalis TaxID=1884907 RepID=UPI000112A1A9
MSKELARAIAAQCLGYPEQSFIDRNAELLNMTHALAPKLREPLVKFLTSAAQMPLNQLQQHYVEIFDMRRKCSLFLTSWTHGDTRNRGMALVYFIQIYKRCGLLLSPHELPDHLAVVLEFAALENPIEGDLLLGEHQAPILLIRDALHKCGSIYGEVLDAVVESLPEMTPEIEARAKALAITGPPKEFVGLSGAVAVALEPFSTREDISLGGVSR